MLQFVYIIIAAFPVKFAKQISMSLFDIVTYFSTRFLFTAGKDVTLGDVLIEGKTKIVYDLPSYKGCVAIKSKDRITCGDGARAHDMEGKAVISNSTNSSLMKILNDAGNFVLLSLFLFLQCTVLVARDVSS